MPDTADHPDQGELVRKLLWRGPTLNTDRIVGVFMDQNNKCNLRCRMCGFSDPRVANLPTYDMPRWLYDRIAAQIFPRSRYVCLSLMTEPFMTKDFPERLRAVRDYEVPYSEVITNGTLLTPAAVEAILDSHLSRVIVSIDGGTKATFEEIRTGARFERVIANWELLRSARESAATRLPALRVNHVLSELNIDSFDDFLHLLEELKPDEVAVRTVSRMSNAVIQETSDAAFWSKVRAARLRLAAFCTRTGVVDSAYLRDRPTRIELFDEDHERLMCRYPWDILAIHPNGDVYPCMAWSRPPIGSFVSDTFDSIWHGPALAELRREFEATRPGLDCLHCSIRRSNEDVDDDFFYRKLAKPAPPSGPPKAQPRIGEAGSDI